MFTKVYADNIANITNKYAISHEHLSDNDLPKPPKPEDIIENIRQKFALKIKKAQQKKQINKVRKLEHYRGKFEFFMNNVPEGFALSSMLYSKPNKSLVEKSKIYSEQIKSGYFGDPAKDPILDDEKEKLQKKIREIFSKEIALVKGKKTKKSVATKEELVFCRCELERLVLNIPRDRVKYFLSDLEYDEDVVKWTRKKFKDLIKPEFFNMLANAYPHELEGFGICRNGIDCMLEGKSVENEDELSYAINADHIIDLAGCGNLISRDELTGAGTVNLQLQTIHVHDGFKNKLKTMQFMLNKELDEEWMLTLAPVKMKNRSGFIAFPQKKGTPFAGIQLINKKIPSAARYAKSLIKKINKEISGKDKVVKGDVTYSLEKSIKKLTSIFKKMASGNFSKANGQVLGFVHEGKDLKHLFNKVADSRLDIFKDLMVHSTAVEEKRLNKGKKYRHEQKPQTELDRQKDKDEKKRIKNKPSLPLPENILLDKELVKICRQENSLMKLHEREEKELVAFQKSLKRFKNQDPDDKKNAYETNFKKAVKRDLTKNELQELSKFKKQKEYSQFSSYLKQKFEDRKKQEILKLRQQKTVVGDELKEFLEKESLLVKENFNKSSVPVSSPKETEVVSTVDEDFERNYKIFNEKYKSKKKVPETKVSLLRESLRKIGKQRRKATEDYKTKKVQLCVSQVKTEGAKIKSLNIEESKFKKDTQKDLGRDLGEKELEKLSKAFKQKFTKFKGYQKEQMQRFNDDHKQVMKLLRLKQTILNTELQEQQTLPSSKPAAPKSK